MSEVLSVTPDRVTFDQVSLPAILALPKGVLADYLPHHGEAARSGMHSGALISPLGALLEAEGLARLERRDPSDLGSLQAAVKAKLDRITLTKTFIAKDLKPATDKAHAIYLLGTANIDLQDFVEVVGKANEWSAGEAEEVKRSMSAELISLNKEDTWGWWLDLLGEYERRKLTFIEMLSGAR